MSERCLDCKKILRRCKCPLCDACDAPISLCKCLAGFQAGQPVPHSVDGMIAWSFIRYESTFYTILVGVNVLSTPLWPHQTGDDGWATEDRLRVGMQLVDTHEIPRVEHLHAATMAVRLWQAAVNRVQKPSTRIHPYLHPNLKVTFPEATRRERLAKLNERLSDLVRPLIENEPPFDPQRRYRRREAANRNLRMDCARDACLLLMSYDRDMTESNARLLIEGACTRAREGAELWPVADFPDGGPISFERLRERERMPRKRC